MNTPLQVGSGYFRRLGFWMSENMHLAWVLVFIVPVYWAMDREPPLRVTSAMSLPATAQSKTLILEFPVERDMNRDCTSQFRKSLIDAAGIRYDFGIEQVVSREAMLEVQRRLGPWLKAAVRIPDLATPGDAIILMEAEFVCNPLQEVWPIKRSARIPIQILPREDS